MRDLVLGLGLIFIGQALIWFQTNGQFVWDSFKRNPLGLAIVFGTIISYLLIKGTFFTVRYFDGLLWPGRFIAFGLGIISFTALTWYYLGEGFTTKTVISLLLAVLLVIIQILWK
jgi:hypothetical protein|tara:strand:+ start:1059 stop:1403 length:345 start_codon:yes stop_codon:yes gene_type:complete